MLLLAKAFGVRGCSIPSVLARRLLQVIDRKLRILLTLQVALDLSSFSERFDGIARSPPSRLVLEQQCVSAQMLSEASAEIDRGTDVCRLEVPRRMQSHAINHNSMPGGRFELPTKGL